MEDFEQNQEVMRNDLDQLKEQVSKLVEAMQALERRRDADGNPPVANQEPQVIPTHHSGFSPVPTQYFINSQGMMMSVPPYGFPPGYTPPLAANPSNGNQPASASNPLNLTESQNPHPGTNEISLAQLPPPTSIEDAQSREKLQILEERIRAIEGNESYGLDAFDMCLVPDVVIPPKFKVPEFDKYKGFTCPKNHLIMYCRKMASHAHDDKLLVHFFQESLTGAALSWYMHLEQSRIRSWKDLADAFLKQYKYNADIAPDRVQLQNMVKKDEETFKEYAQHWRELAAQVKPPLSEKEIVSMFIDTLQSPFYDKMIGNVSSNFPDLVVIGERVEMGMRSGKIAHNPAEAINAKKPLANLETGKEGEAHAVMTTPTGPNYMLPQFGQAYQSPIVHYPYVATTSQSPYPQPHLPQTPYPQPHLPQTPQPNQQWNHNPNANQRKPPNDKRRKPVHFDPIPMSYTNLLPCLIHQSLIVPSPMKPIEPPYPREYDPNAKCDYHAGAIGHSTENCRTLKHKVQDMINARWLNFDGNNLVPSHEGPSTDAIEGSPPMVFDGAFET